MNKSAGGATNKTTRKWPPRLAGRRPLCMTGSSAALLGPDDKLGPAQKCSPAAFLSLAAAAEAAHFPRNSSSSAANQMVAGHLAARSAP